MLSFYYGKLEDLTSFGSHFTTGFPKLCVENLTFLVDTIKEWLEVNKIKLKSHGFTSSQMTQIFDARIGILDARY